MCISHRVLILQLLTLGGLSGFAQETKPWKLRTEVSIVGEAFHINGKPTYEGRTWNGKKIEGLLLNSRMSRMCSPERGFTRVTKRSFHRRWRPPDIRSFITS